MAAIHSRIARVLLKDRYIKRTLETIKFHRTGFLPPGWLWLSCFPSLYANKRLVFLGSYQERAVIFFSLAHKPSHPLRFKEIYFYNLEGIRGCDKSNFFTMWQGEGL